MIVVSSSSVGANTIEISVENGRFVPIVNGHKVGIINFNEGFISSFDTVDAADSAARRFIAYERSIRNEKAKEK